ncbi:DNA polymerase epsilon catalytic subunit A [Striga asiatica]|uniref:DNA polymerase epsilon catalytic subunit A n=1 Tax=Striga asiatica TaxID=4170 RepID=A0A5A7PNU4_STRAF|nr:DNA polymerase epsilon catalytic subunit A [Striga asiatica]
MVSNFIVYFSIFAHPTIFLGLSFDDLHFRPNSFVVCGWRGTKVQFLEIRGVELRNKLLLERMQLRFTVHQQGLEPEVLLPEGLDVGPQPLGLDLCAQQAPSEIARQMHLFRDCCYDSALSRIRMIRLRSSSSAAPVEHKLVPSERTSDFEFTPFPPENTSDFTLFPRLYKMFLNECLSGFASITAFHLAVSISACFLITFDDLTSFKSISFSSASSFDFLSKADKI